MKHIAIQIDVEYQQNVEAVDSCEIKESASNATPQSIGMLQSKSNQT